MKKVTINTKDSIITKQFDTLEYKDGNVIVSSKHFTSGEFDHDTSVTVDDAVTITIYKPQSIMIY